MEGVATLFQAVSLTSVDGALVLGCLLVGAVYGFFAGRGRVAIMTLSLYGALALVVSVPIFSSLSRAAVFGSVPNLRVFFFLVLFLVIFLVLWRNHFLRALSCERGAFWQAGIMGALNAGLFTSTIFFLLPGSFTVGLGPLSRYLFLDDLPRSGWLLAPLIFFCFWRPTEHLSGRVGGADEDG